MPIPAGPLIIAGAEIAGQGINAWTTGRMNKKTRKWNEKMYWLQRQHALEDWNAMNAYNAPEAQMNRLRTAGLNPHLVYGSGADAGSAGTVRSSDSGSWNPEAPKVDFGAAASKGLSAYYDFQLKQAQTNNVKANTDVLEQDVDLKRAQEAGVWIDIAKKQVDTKHGLFDLQMKEALQKNTIDLATANLDKIRTETGAIHDRNVREGEMNVAQIAKMGEEVLSLRLGRAKTQAEIDHINQQIKNLQEAKTTAELENQLREIGVQPGDRPIWRLILGNLVPRNWKRKPVSKGNAPAWKWKK